MSNGIIRALTTPDRFAPPMAKRDQILALFELADRKGYDVTQSTMRDHG
jgi:hypothetical protein